MRLLAPALLALTLAGCAHLNTPPLETLRGLWSAPAPSFAKGFEYLEVTVDGRRALMALGSRQWQEGAWFEQWFSGQGEMLELRDGRIHRVLGMTREVRQTRAQPPGWQTLQAGGPTAWSRDRQVMPGYQMRREQVLSRQVSAVRPVPADARWVEDQVEASGLDGRPWRFRERFALIEGRVVHSEQCISPDLCLTLRPLGVPQP